MTAVRRSELGPGEVGDPIRWLVTVTSRPPTINTSDEELERFLPQPGRRAIRSFGHNADGSHVLITYGGTNLHTDTAYLRYSHQYVLRNDGTRIRGLLDQPESAWHPPMVPGVMYCLDTHSPHQGLPDPRLGGKRKDTVKVVLAVDRDHELRPEDAFVLLRRLWHVSLSDLDYRPGARPPRWKET